MEDFKKFEQYYSPSTGETMTVLGDDIPLIEEQMNWFDEHPDAIWMVPKDSNAQNRGSTSAAAVRNSD